MNMSQVKRSTCRECEVIRMDDKKMEIMISMNYKNSNDLASDVKGIIEAAQTMVNRQINSTLTKRNWLIGYRISEEIMKNLDRKDVYGKQTMKNLAADLQGVYKENFDVSNLYKFKQFYEMYSDILDTASLKSFEKLTWSHYRVLLQVKDDKARTWYEKEAAEQTWSVKTLQRIYHHNIIIECSVVRIHLSLKQK